MQLVIEDHLHIRLNSFGTFAFPMPCVIIRYQIRLERFKICILLCISQTSKERFTIHASHYCFNHGFNTSGHL